MTQLTLNIENNEMLGVLKNLIKHLNGVSIAATENSPHSKESMKSDFSETIAADIRASYGEAMDHIKGKIELPLAKDIKF